jgi:hypothetical protein
MIKKLLLSYCFFFCICLNAQRSPEIIETDMWFGGSWVLSSKADYTFNASCLPFIGVSQGVIDVVNGGLENISRTTNTYNSNNIIEEFIFELWNTNNSIWENSRRATFNYSGQNLLESIIYIWINNAWQPDTKTIGNYNGNLQAESILQTWDNINSIWVNSTKSDYIYDNEGRLTTLTEFLWENNNWVNNEQSNNTYNTNFNLDTIIQLIWDVNTSSWLNKYRTIYTYNNSDLLIEREREEWINGQWIKRDKKTNNYDVNNRVNESINSEWNETLMAYEFKSRNLITRNSEGLRTIVVSQTYTGGWINSSRTRNTYPPCATLSEEEFSYGKIKLYPNPSNSILNIDLPTLLINSSIKIFDMQGKLVIQKSIKEIKNTIDISSLSKGLYIAKLEDKTHSKAMRFFVK